MSCDFSLLERGAVCLALYPYTTGFPLDRVTRDVEDDLVAQLERHDSIESIATQIEPGSKPPEVVATMKLRRVLLLQTGTSPSLQDVLVARIDSVSDKKRGRANWYAKLKSNIHTAHYLLGSEEAHGTNGKEAYVDAMNVTRIKKATILRRTGLLTDEEMRDVTERLVRTLELDLSRYFEENAAS